MSDVFLNDTELADCVAAFRKYYGLEVTTEQVKELLASHADVQEEIYRHGASDTVVRGDLADVLVQSLDFGYDHWPVNHEGTFKKFWSEFRNRAERAGYKIVGDEAELTKQDIEAKPCPGCGGKLHVVEFDRARCYCEDCRWEGEGSNPHNAYMSLFNKMW